MADNKKVSAPAERRVQIMLPLLEDPKAPREEYFAVNGKSFIIRRGEYVKVPEYVAEVIANSQAARMAAIKFVDEKALREPKKDI